MDTDPTDAVASSVTDTRIRLTDNILREMPIHLSLRKLDRNATTPNLLALDERRPDWFLNLWHYVYRLYDTARQSLYIGKSSCSAIRLATHRQNARWWWLAEYIAISIYPTEAAALEAERAAIRSEQPRFNRSHLRGPANVLLHVHGPANDAAALLFREARPEFIAELAVLLATPERYPQPEAPPAPTPLPVAELAQPTADGPTTS